MRHLHSLPFSHAELVVQRDLLWDNILSAFGLILECMEEWEIKAEERNEVSFSKFSGEKGRDDETTR